MAIAAEVIEAAAGVVGMTGAPTVAAAAAAAVKLAVHTSRRCHGNERWARLQCQFPRRGNWILSTANFYQ